MSDLPSLDDVFREAKAQLILKQKAKDAAALRATSHPKAITTQALFGDPANWRRTRGVALVHAETETVLGQFEEWVHVSVAGCRKLLREHGSIEVSGVERVSGSWWLGEQHHVEPRQAWHEKRPAILHLHLDTLRVHSPACEVVVHLSYGGIARVELAQDTQFAQEHGKQEQLLFLPAGTNVLEVMSLDSKINLRVELALP